MGGVRVDGVAIGGDRGGVVIVVLVVLDVVALVWMKVVVLMVVMGLVLA